MHLQLLLISLMEKHPEVFYENIRIGAIYGTFPGAIWNGGRTVLGQCDAMQMEYVLSEFNGRGIPLRFTFTNSLIGQEHLEDEFCNLCLQLAVGSSSKIREESDAIESAKDGQGAADDGERNIVHNEVLVNSPVLEAYIRENYPSLPLISSTTKQIRSVEELAGELAKDYKLVVVYKAMNHDPALLTMPGRERLEILLDSFCMDHCPRSAEHYLAASQAQLEGRELIFPTEGKCHAINRDFYDFFENESFVTVEELYGRFCDAGFCHFKLDGRTFTDADVIESYVYYMVRPDYQERVRLILHKGMEKLRRMG